MTTEVHNLVLTKHMARSRDDVIDGQLQTLVEGVTQSGIRMTGWEIAENPVGTGGDNLYSGVGWTRKGDKGDWNYEMYLKLSFHHETREPAQGAFQSILNTTARLARANNYGRWTLSTVDGEDFEEMETGNTFVDITIKGESIEYAKVELPPFSEFVQAFSHLYGLNDNLELMYEALMAGVDSDWINRPNVAFIGPPGCGKSDICTTLRGLLGDDAVWELDAVATTKAGAIKALSQRDVLPRVVVIEELEKVPNEDALSFLLGILDNRASIRKVTARENVEMEAKIFGICTVNDETKFLKLAYGALADRFAHKVYFERPTREMLGKICIREVEKINGSRDWIKPCLDYCDAYNNGEGIELSPRTVIAWLVTGKDKWMTGRFQQILNSTQKKRVPLTVDEEMEVV